jgi:anti-sigma regulatory factor (Ser/Thr protein kinase)
MPRVLLIGADSDVGRAVQAQPSASKYDMQFVPGSVEALRVLRGRPIDVVITDPETTMREDLALAAEMAAIRPGLRTIVLASGAAPDDIIAALRACVFAVFSPPYEATEIAAMVEHALEHDEWRQGIEMTSDLPHWLTVRLACSLVDGERLVRFMSELQADVPQPQRDDLLMAFREVLVNAMEHGCGMDPDKVIEVTAARTKRAIVYHFRDPGHGFAHATPLPHAATSNPPDQPLAHAEYRTEHGFRPGGFGILIAKKLVDEMTYNGPGNEVILVKYTA